MALGKLKALIEKAIGEERRDEALSHAERAKVAPAWTHLRRIACDCRAEA